MLAVPTLVDHSAEALEEPSRGILKIEKHSTVNLDHR